MIFLTEIEEKCRQAAVNLILDREKQYELFGQKEITRKSILCNILRMTDDIGEEHLRYPQSGILLAITVPLTKLYFLSNATFHILKSNRDKLDAFATYIEHSTLRVV